MAVGVTLHGVAGADLALGLAVDNVGVDSVAGAEKLNKDMTGYKDKQVGNANGFLLSAWTVRECRVVGREIDV